AGSGGFVIPLSSDHPDLASVPATVTLPAGQSAAEFSIITSPAPVATVVVLSAGTPGTGASVTLQINGLGLTLPQVNGAVTPPVYNPANGHWYQAVRVPGGINWHDAR